MLRLNVRARLILLSFVATSFACAHETPGRQGDGAQPDKPAASLGMDACVSRALASNFAVKIQQFPVSEAIDSVVIAHAAFTPTFNYSGLKDVNQAAVVPGSLNLINGIPATRSTEESSTFSIVEPIQTGATVAANYSMARGETKPAIDFPNPAYDNTASITVIQPLLQGAGTDYNRAAIASAKLGVKIARLNFKSTVLTTIFNVETAYFNLLYAREQYKVQQDTLKLAQELYDENIIKRQTGVLTDLDVMQAKVGVATARNQLILDEQQVHNNEDLLLQTLGERDFKTSVGPIVFPSADQPDTSFDRAYKLARDNGPNLAITEATIEQYKLIALKARRNTLPQVNLSGGIGRSSAALSDYQASFGSWTGNSWSAGVTVSVPWGMQASRAAYRQAMAGVRSEETILDQNDQALIVQVRSAVRAVDTNTASVQASTEETQLAEKEYELQKAEFDAGLATSYDVLQAQNSLETARVTELQAKVALLTAIADLRFLEGSSLQRYHVNLPE